VSKTQRPLAEAERIAASIVADLAPSCARIQVAGSVRRHKQVVGDIEMVAIPRYAPAGLFGDCMANLLWGYTDLLALLEKRQGEEYDEMLTLLDGYFDVVTVHQRPLASRGLRRRVRATVPATPRSCVPRVPLAARVRQPRRSLGVAAAWWRSMRRGVSTPVSMDRPVRGDQGRTT
jgi:hypothetical protein